MLRTFLISFFVAAFLFTSKAQFSIGITLSGIGFHPRKEKYENTDLYKWNIDKKGRFVAFSSLTFFLSYRFNNYIGVKLMQSIVSHDCAGHFAGITHFGIDLHDDILAMKNPQHQFSVSFGPFWYYRKNWNTEPNYMHDAKYLKLSNNHIWETKFVWYGGQVEYSYLPDNSNIAYTVNFLPAIPYLYTLGVGAKYIQ